MENRYIKNFIHVYVSSINRKESSKTNSIFSCTQRFFSESSKHMLNSQKILSLKSKAMPSRLTTHRSRERRRVPLVSSTLTRLINAFSLLFLWFLLLNTICEFTINLGVGFLESIRVYFVFVTGRHIVRLPKTRFNSFVLVRD